MYQQHHQYGGNIQAPGTQEEVESISEAEKEEKG